MGKQQMADGMSAANSKFVIVGRDQLESRVDDRPHWFLRATNWVGITMARTETPNGWSFNPATATLTLVVAGLLTGGGYYFGSVDKERTDIQQRLKTAEEVATNSMIQKAVDEKEKQFRQEEMSNMSREVRILRQEVKGQ